MHRSARLRRKSKIRFWNCVFGKDLPLKYGTVGELLAAASANERGASDRYREVARLARSRDDLAAADTAISLAAEADKRAAAILARAGGAAPAAATAVSALDCGAGMAERWNDLVTGSGLTAYRVLAHAVAATASAFASYAYVASDAQNDAVRAMAETLALEELDRAARLRKERRRAFRTRKPQSAAPQDEEEALPQIRISIARLAGLLEALARNCETAGDPASARLLLSLTPKQPDRHNSAADFVGMQTPEDALRRALFELQAAAETLENLAGRAREETVLAGALARLEEVVEAITRIGQRLHQLRVAAKPAPLHPSA